MTSVSVARWASATVSLVASLSCGSPARVDHSAPVHQADEIDEIVLRYEALGRFSGAIGVSRNGEHILSRGYGLADRETGAQNTANTEFGLGSLTKQFTAAAILKLESEGRLMVEDTISTHLPDYPRPQGDQVTIHHLLSHTSGIPSLWRLGDGLEDVQATGEPVTTDELLRYFQDRELLFEPGERYRYSNSGFVVLAAIIEEISGMSYADFLDEALFRPLDMKDTGCASAADGARPYSGYPPDIHEIPLEHPSWSIGDGCVSSTVVDLLKWDAALNDDSFLPPVQREKLFTKHSEVRPGVGYGYGWFLSTSHDRLVAHHSGAGEGIIAEMYRFVDEPLSIVALANYAPEIGINAPGSIIEQAASLSFGLPVDLPPAVANLPGDEISRFVGRYEINGGGAFDVEVEEGHLWVEGVENDVSIFDYGMLEEPGVLPRGASSAMTAVEAGLAGNFAGIPFCQPLRKDLAPGELDEEWREILEGRGELVEMSPVLAQRYPGDDTFFVVNLLLFEGGEVFFALDLTPALEICGWYVMDRTEFEIRASFERPQRVPLVPVGPNEFLADGFNYRENDVRLTFQNAGDVDRMHLEVIGAVHHAGSRTSQPGSVD